MKIITLTLSPALDVTYAIPGEVKRGLNRADSFSLTAGGKGINVARTIVNEAKKFGTVADVSALYPSGGAVGDMLTAALVCEKIPTVSVKTEENCRINVSAVAESGDDVEINARGAYVSEDELSQIEKELCTLTAGDVLAICGSVPSGVDKSYYAELIQRMKARGVVCVLDCDGDALRIAVTSDCPPDYVKPNEHEIHEFCESVGVAASGESIVEVSCGKVSVIATYGGSGAAIISSRDGNTEKITSDTTSVKPVRVKGAGDTLLGAFLYHKFVMEKSDEAALSAAVKAAGEYVSGDDGWR